MCHLSVLYADILQENVDAGTDITRYGNIRTLHVRILRTELILAVG